MFRNFMFFKDLEPPARIFNFIIEPSHHIFTDQFSNEESTTYKNWSSPIHVTTTKITLS